MSATLELDPPQVRQPRILNPDGGDPVELDQIDSLELDVGDGFRWHGRPLADLDDDELVHVEDEFSLALRDLRAG